ncbi:MAG: hypothetical protein RLZZ233_1274 [Verrucomicrobiota bacterium]|jgi:hypothetical protein
MASTGLAAGTMRTFHLMKGEAVSAPLSEAEVAAMIASGELKAEHPCHLVGEDAWRTVGDFFPMGSGLKVRAKKDPPSEAEQISTANRIDDLTRRRLLVYGLADAVTIDQFTQAQAVTAIVARERELRSRWLAHRTAQVSAFVAFLVAGVAVCSTVNPVSLRIEKSAALLQQQDGDAKANYSVLRSTLRDRAYLIERERRENGFSPRPAGK